MKPRNRNHFRKGQIVYARRGYWDKRTKTWHLSASTRTDGTPMKPYKTIIQALKDTYAEVGTRKERREVPYEHLMTEAEYNLVHAITVPEGL